MNMDIISIIIPTYKEAQNVPVLSEKIDNAMKEAGLLYEIIVIDDDSNDGIIDAVDKINMMKYFIGQRSTKKLT